MLNKFTEAGLGIRVFSYVSFWKVVGVITLCHVFALGKPVITSLTKHRPGDANYKVLTCEADGVPEPNFQWSVNSTDVSVCEFSIFCGGKSSGML